MTKSGRKKYGTVTVNDEEMQVLMQFSESGFPASIEEFPDDIKPYFNFKEQIAMFCSMAKS
jgi:hypothetical protein